VKCWRTDDRRRTKSDDNSSHGLKARWAKKVHSTRFAVTSDKVYQLLAHGQWFCPASSTTKTGRHYIAESGVKTPKIKSNQLPCKSNGLLVYIPICSWIMFYLNTFSGEELIILPEPPSSPHIHLFSLLCHVLSTNVCLFRQFELLPSHGIR
jgi:hypothetical protein